MARNPASDVKVGRVQSGQHHKAVPRSLILRLLAELRASERPIDVRDHALIVTFLAVGARRAEVAALKVSDIEREEEGKSYLRLMGKGGKVALMLLREGTLRAIDRWLKEGGHGGNPTSPLFHNLSHRPDHRERRSLSSNGIWHIVKRRFGKYSPHGLRARSISDVWQRSDQNLHMAQVFARHSSPTVTEQVYVQAEKLDIAMTYAPDYE